jgi:hypothetical protein
MKIFNISLFGGIKDVTVEEGLNLHHGRPCLVITQYKKEELFILPIKSFFHPEEGSVFDCVFIEDGNPRGLMKSNPKEKKDVNDIIIILNACNYICVHPEDKKFIKSVNRDHDNNMVSMVAIISKDSVFKFRTLNQKKPKRTFNLRYNHQKSMVEVIEYKEFKPHAEEKPQNFFQRLKIRFFETLTFF